MGNSSKREKIYSAAEVAAMCGVVNQTTVNWIRSGHLKAFITPGGQYRVYADNLVTFLTARSMRLPKDLVSSVGICLDDSMILVVDDDKDLNDVLKRLLERRFPGIAVIQAYDGFEAGRLMIEHHPSLVLLDVNLPGVDGRILCRRLKTETSFGRPAVLAFSGVDRAEIKEHLLAEGADDFFAKPLDFEALLTRTAALRSKEES